MERQEFKIRELSRLESLHWSVIFPHSLAEKQPRKAYLLANKGLKLITDVVND